MDRKLRKFMETETRSKAQILDNRHVEVQTPDGELFTLLTNIGEYNVDETEAFYLHLIELIFDKHFSDDKEKMTNLISWELYCQGINFMGMTSGNRQGERIRIGKKIRELREKKGMEARDLALLANIDAANLSRIEQGKYSTGLDILSRIAFVLGAHLDLIPNEE